MVEHNFQNSTKLLPILKYAKDTYLVWYVYYQSLPKLHRYSLGLKVDSILSEIIESLAAAGFLKQPDKQHFLNIALRKLDTLKIFIMILWETKSLDNKKYILLSEKLEEMGKMLGGWLAHSQKQNSPNKS